MSKCPRCGKYLKDVVALVDGFDQVKKVEGKCKKHGVIETNDWEYWDFYPDTAQPFDLAYPDASRRTR